MNQSSPTDLLIKSLLLVQHFAERLQNLNTQLLLLIHQLLCVLYQPISIQIPVKKLSPLKSFFPILCGGSDTASGTQDSENPKISPMYVFFIDLTWECNWFVIAVQQEDRTLRLSKWLMQTQTWVLMQWYRPIRLTHTQVSAVRTPKARSEVNHAGSYLYISLKSHLASDPSAMSTWFCLPDTNADLIAVYKSVAQTSGTSRFCVQAIGF